MMSPAPEPTGLKRFLPRIGSPGYHLLLATVAILILGPLGGISAAFMNFSIGFFIGGQVLAAATPSAAPALRYVKRRALQQRAELDALLDQMRGWLTGRGNPRSDDAADPGCDHLAAKVFRRVGHGPRPRSRHCRPGVRAVSRLAGRVGIGAGGAVTGGKTVPAGIPAGF